ncbi:hypothetical protein VPHK165_0015 [Vibrio phage K165]|nr:hypothetical protein NVP1105O_12 [Vibrio phage 1.105.O._10N.286.49.B4]QZI89639.1 hypothetical protein MYOV022v2_p0012 [Vibrio phage 12E28.1]QZI90181.1 hypothetical protein MYOV021v2_p0012 [Vibrio phage 18E29.1]QZI90626.1 hypothetical protein MYOV023v1_p0079 [Vibrio phage 91E28.1a]QZI90704.1 hypothetical protein MYOV020v1_p0078 [Vibrio phage 98E28.6a]CAH9015063.1 conserved hypothetical protein [Vibrio phage 466E53-1]
MDRIVTFKRDGKVTKMTIGGFTDDPADDLSRFSRGELEKILMSDKNSPIMIRVK